MAEVFYDKDADLSVLHEKTIAIIGYGNQGRAQALNLRDNDQTVIVGNVRDASWEQAEKDGFEVYQVREAAQKAAIIFLLVPDEVAPWVFETEIRPGLSPEKTLDFASGYNITYGFIVPPADVDVALLAPRMIGRSVRDLFVAGQGAPSLVGVHQDYSGQAQEIVLALAKGIGSTRAGAVWSSFEEETLADLFGEQVVGASLFLTRMAYEVMREAGVSEEAALLELTLSGELSEVHKAISELGLWEQLKLHSRTSQYGQQTRGPRVVTEQTRQVLRGIMRDIQDGTFAKEWYLEQEAKGVHFRRLWRENLKHPFIEAEQRVMKILRPGRQGE